MKLNDKGMTLMELLISIVLVGIALTFLFQLLADLKNETSNNNYAYNNQVNRTEAIYTIEQDLFSNTLIGLEDKSTEDSLIINFYYKKENASKTAVLETATNIYTDEVLKEEITKYYLRYTNVDGEKYSWEMKGAKIDPCGSFTYYLDLASNSYYFKLNIYLYNSVYHEKNNEETNNAVDDIEITYAGLKDDLVTTNGSYLTGSPKRNKPIGICAN